MHRKDIKQNNWQKSRKDTIGFFIGKQKKGLSLTDSPWVTLAVGIQLQNLVIEGVIKEGMKVLDVGCSIGIEAMYLSKQGLDATGIDFVPETIDIAKKLAGLTGSKSKFISGDFLETNFTNEKRSYDLIIDQGCFHHFPIKDRVKYAQKIDFLLKKGGLFFLRGFSDHMLPSPTNDGPIRLSSDDIVGTFDSFLKTDRLFRFKNIPLPKPHDYKPQIFWAYLGKKN